MRALIFAAFSAFAVAACHHEEAAAPAKGVTNVQPVVAADPGAALLAYEATLHGATRFEQVLPHLSAGNRKGILESVPAEERPDLLRDLQRLEPKNVRVDDVRIEGDRAVVLAHGDVESPMGKELLTAQAHVTMVLEEGRWRLDRARWTLDAAPKEPTY